MAYTGKNRPSGNMLSPSRILQLEKTAAALELRKRGKTFDEIADICGWANRNGAFLAIQRELSRRISEPADSVLAARDRAPRCPARWPLGLGHRYPGLYHRGRNAAR
jgi:hypothetical protein